MFSDADIADARGIIDDASPGPWSTRAAVVFDVEDMVVADCGNWIQDVPPGGLSVMYADAAFIAAARDGWSRALDEIERLRSLLAISEAK